MSFHHKTVAETIAELRTDILAGLSPVEAGVRLAQYGPNELTEKKKKTLFMMFLDQFKDFMILILIAAAFISGIIGEASDTIAIIVIVVLNAVIGFVQEYRAEKAMALLRKMAAQSAMVVRGNSMPRRLKICCWRYNGKASANLATTIWANNPSEAMLLGIN